MGDSLKFLNNSALPSFFPSSSSSLSAFSCSPSPLSWIVCFSPVSLLTVKLTWKNTTWLLGEHPSSSLSLVLCHSLYPTTGFQAFTSANGTYLWHGWPSEHTLDQEFSWNTFTPNVLLVFFAQCIKSDLKSFLTMTYSWLYFFDGFPPFFGILHPNFLWKGSIGGQHKMYRRVKKYLSLIFPQLAEKNKQPLFILWKSMAPFNKCTRSSFYVGLCM